MCQNLGSEQPQLKEDRKSWGDGKGLGKSHKIEGGMWQSLRGGREIDVSEVIAAEKGKNSLAQEQHWFKALQEKMKIHVCKLEEEEKEEQEKKNGYMLKFVYL